MAQTIYSGAFKRTVVRARGILPAVRDFKIMAMPDTPPVTRPAGEAINATESEKVIDPRIIDSHFKILFLYFIVIVFRKIKKIIGILEKNCIC